jgi:large conductance mechanosensitive channel protein
MSAKSKDKQEKTRLITRREVVVSLPVVNVPAPFQGFVDFVREQGVVGLAVGLVLGTQVKVLVDQVVASFINPLLGLLLPGKGSLPEKVFHVTFRGKGQDFMWGAFLSQLISFLAVAFIIYLIVHRLKLDRLDKKKA